MDNFHLLLCKKYALNINGFVGHLLHYSNYSTSSVWLSHERFVANYEIDMDDMTLPWSLMRSWTLSLGKLLVLLEV